MGALACKWRLESSLPESLLFFHHLDPGIKLRSSGSAAITLDAEPSQQPTQRFFVDTVLCTKLPFINLLSRFCGGLPPKVSLQHQTIKNKMTIVSMVTAPVRFRHLVRDTR